MVTKYSFSVLLFLVLFGFVLSDVPTESVNDESSKEVFLERELKGAETASPILGTFGNWFGGNGGYRPNHSNRPGGYNPYYNYWGNRNFGGGYPGGYNFYSKGYGNGYGGITGNGGYGGYGLYGNSDGFDGYAANAGFGYGGYNGYGSYGGYGGVTGFENGWGYPTTGLGTGYGTSASGGYYPTVNRNYYSSGYNNKSGFVGLPLKK